MHSTKRTASSALVLSLAITTTCLCASSYNAQNVQKLVEFQTETSVNQNIDIQYSDLEKTDRKQVDCLAKNIYYEAGFEPRQGQVAVAAVTMNRVLSGNYASSVCGVVYQNNGKTYQFSWAGMKNKLSKINQEVYNEVLAIATKVYLNYDPSIDDPTKGATYYHADYVNPRWKLQRVKKIGAHIFYRHNQDVKNIGLST